MPDQMDTLGTLVDEVKSAWPAGFPPSVLVADATSYLRLAAPGTGTPGWRVPMQLPADLALDDLIALTFPQPTTTATPDVVASDIEGAIDGMGGLPSALEQLAGMDWMGRWDVIFRLGSRGPTLGGQTYLELLEAALRTLPDVDQRVAGAVLADVLARGGRTVASEALEAWLRLTQSIMVVDSGSQIEIMGHLHIPPEAAEGTLALMHSEAPDISAILPVMAAAIVPPSWLGPLNDLWDAVDAEAQTFLDFAKPAGQPYGYYIGTQMHLTIAAAYRLKHLPHTVAGGGGPLAKANIWTNVTPVLTILGALQTKFAFQGSGIAKGLAVSRPDIFEFGMVHGMPPGWVFEIKPASLGTGAPLAAAEVAFYATVLTMCDIPAVPGPVLADGTSGTLPTVGGWVVWVCPFPGVILYRYKQASKNAQAQRAQVPVYSAQRDQTQAWVQASGLAANLTLAAMLGCLVGVLWEFGWVLLL